MLEVDFTSLLLFRSCRTWFSLFLVVDPSVIRHSLNKIVNVGKDFCFGCQMYTTKNLPVGIKWYKNGSPVSPENRRFNISIMQKGKFNKLWTHFCINSVQLGDKGNYKCEIESSNSSYSKEGVLQVYGKIM